LVVCNVDNSVSVIDVAERRVTATIPSGLNPACVAIAPDGSYGLVGGSDPRLTFIDIAARTSTRIDAHAYASAIAVAPNGLLGLVAHGVDNYVDAF
jgi:YVTN family beta-propeller protein